MGIKSIQVSVFKMFSTYHRDYPTPAEKHPRIQLLGLTLRPEVKDMSPAPKGGHVVIVGLI